MRKKVTMWEAGELIQAARVISWAAVFGGGFGTFSQTADKPKKVVTVSDFSNGRDTNAANVNMRGSPYGKLGGF